MLTPLTSRVLREIHKDKTRSSVSSFKIQPSLQGPTCQGTGTRLVSRLWVLKEGQCKQPTHICPGSLPGCAVPIRPDPQRRGHRSGCRHGVLFLLLTQGEEGVWKLEVGDRCSSVESQVPFGMKPESGTLMSNFGGMLSPGA